MTVVREGRGGGRGRDRGGRRVLHVKQFEQGEEEKLRDLHAESSEQEYVIWNEKVLQIWYSHRHLI